jgi:hypothetical protein
MIEATVAQIPVAISTAMMIEGVIGFRF